MCGCIVGLSWCCCSLAVSFLCVDVMCCGAAGLSLCCLFCWCCGDVLSLRCDVVVL